MKESGAKTPRTRDVRPDSRRRWGALALTLSVLFALLFHGHVISSEAAGDGADENRWEVLPGSFANDRRMADLLRHAEIFRRRAFDELRQRWTLTPGSTPLRWRIETSAPVSNLRGVDPRRGEKTRSLRANHGGFELGRTYFDEGQVVIRLPARKFLAAPRRLQPVLLHECAHAVFASRLGTRARYEALPFWFREGIALVVSGEGASRLRERVAYTVFEGRSPDAFLVGPRPLEPGLRMSSEEAFAMVDAIRTRIGNGVFKAFVAEIARGSVDAACRKFIGVSKEAVRLRAAYDVRITVSGLISPDLVERFQRAYERFGAGETGAIAELRRMLDRGPDSPLSGTLRYLIVREGIRVAGSGPPEASIKDRLRALLGSRDALWRPEALVLSGRIEQLAMRYEKARNIWLATLEEFGEDRLVAERVRRLLAQLDGGQYGKPR